MSPLPFVRRLFARLGFARAPIDGAGWELPAAPHARREAALWAYRTLLLRNPESQASLEHLARSPSARAMRDALLRSAEARAQPGFPILPSMSGDEPAQPVQVRVSPAQLDALFARVQAVWHALGEEEPHYSVVTAEAFRPGRIEETLAQFYASGEANVATVLRTLARNGIARERLARCIDFGCGVGRLTAALAPHFAQVLGVDVSSSHLAHAREMAQRCGLAHAAWRQVTSVADVARLPEADFVLSLIVLQHNPPPVMRALLDALLGRVAPGGAAMIQVPTYLPAGYAFDARRYLEQPAGGMEMHALPQREVFAVAQERGLEVLEVLEDHWIGYGAGTRSNTFVMRRPA